MAHRDRLSYLGFKFIEHICKQYDCHIMICCQDNEINNTHELVDNLFAVITLFITKYNSHHVTDNHHRRMAEKEA